MRILVTQMGEDLIKVMTEENDLYQREKSRKNLRDSIKSQEVKTRNLLKTQNNFLKTNNKRFKKDLLNNLEHDQTKISTDDLQSAKEIPIHQKRLIIPKNVTDKYNTENKNNSNLPSLVITGANNNNNNNILSANNTIDSDHSNTRQKITVKQILNNKAYKNLKQTIISDKNMKDKLSFIDENKFRSTYSGKTTLQRVDDILNKKINPDRINFIKYLNTKDKISEVQIKRINEFDEEKINRVNKICQIVFHNEERANIFKESIKERIFINKNKDKVEYKRYLNNMGANIKKTEDILTNYSKTIDKRERYKDIHNELVKNYWVKNNVDFIARKTFKFHNMDSNRETSEINSNINASRQLNITQSEY